MTIIENALINGIVSPAICNELRIAGLTDRVHYKWKMYKDRCVLISYAFDEDEYYKSGDLHNDFITPPEAVWPAYTIKDVERVLPVGWFMTSYDKGYEVSLSSLYKDVESCKAARMPDAFAGLLLSAIRRRAVNLRKVNDTLVFK